MTKRCLSIIIAAVLLLCTAAVFPSGEVFADSQNPDSSTAAGTLFSVNSSTGVWFRTSPQISDSNKITVIASGGVVEFIAMSGEWANVKYGDRSGYVMALYLSRLDVISNADTLTRLDALRQKFPDGKYWNHYGSEAPNLDGWTETPCPSHSETTQWCNGQCDGFARKLGLDLFGYAASGWERKTTLDGLCVGDIIRYRSRHSVVVTGFGSSEDIITIADCNWDYHCIIDWDRDFSLSRYVTASNNTDYYVLHVPYNTLTREVMAAGVSTTSSTTTTQPTVSSTDVTSTTTTTTVPSETGSFEIYEASAVMLAGDTRRLSVISTYPSIADKEIVWQSSDESVAAVSSDGVVTSVGVGTARITAVCGNYSDSCTVKVCGSLTRLGGSDRIDTACLIAEKGWSDGCETAILTNGYAFADALAGVPLAGALNAPILLTGSKGALETRVSDTLTRLKVESVVILGGTSVVGAAIEDQLVNAGYAVSRLAGDDRYGTAVAIAERLAKTKSSGFAEVYFACSSNYPDALSIGSVASIKGCPILYAPRTGALDKLTSEYAEKLGCDKATILGGTAAVSEDAAVSIKALGFQTVERIAGEDRYETSLAIFAASKELFSSSDLSFATGVNFPDALAGGAFAARKGTAVILTDGERVYDAYYDIVSFDKLANAYVFGGEAIVPTSIVKEHFRYWSYTA